jgi:putative oxidoreductase
MTNRTNDFAALALRLAAGAIFIPHGYSKVFSEGGVGAFAADMPSYGIPHALGYVVPWAELGGGALLIVGLLTRLDALLLAGTMFVAAFVVLLPDALREAQPGSIRIFAGIRGIETPLAMLAITVALLLAGGGRYSLDALLGIDRRLAALLPKRKAAAEAAAVSIPKG